jgi:Na+/phosphate symporter
MVAAFGLFVSARDRSGLRAALFTYLGVLAAPVLFPCLLGPVSGLYALLAQQDTVLITHVAANVSIPAVAAPFSLLFWLAAQWFIADTAAALDAERRLWGTYAPPLPIQEDEPAPEPPPVVPPSTPPEPRRW